MIVIRSCVRVLTLSAVLCAAAYADIRFSGLDIAPSDIVLFTATHEYQGEDTYSVLFAADAATRQLNELTFYPENILVLDEGRRLLVRNMFGLFMTERGFAGLKAVRGLPSFAGGGTVRPDKFKDTLPAPDGSLVLRIRQTDSAHGDLLVCDTLTGAEFSVSSGVRFSSAGFPALWSPDSRHFVYAKNDELYYCSATQLRFETMPDEAWRKFSGGAINQVRWGSDGFLYVVSGRSVFCIMPQEFFTGALYAGIVQPGRLVGTMPFAFDPNFDEFRLSPDNTQILLCASGRALSLCALNNGVVEAAAVVPYVLLRGHSVIHNVLWPAKGELTVITASVQNGGRVLEAVRFPASQPAHLTAACTMLDISTAFEAALSPDGSMVALVERDAIVIRRYADWSLIHKLDVPGALHTAWVSPKTLISASSHVIELIELAAGQRRTFIALSQADAYGWSAAAPNRVFARSGSAVFQTKPDQADWKPTAAYEVRPASLVSDHYRVYSDALDTGSYKNSVMLRSVNSVGTVSLIQAPPLRYQPFPAADTAPCTLGFDHGSRIRRREAALVFNAYDNAEGLAYIMNVLNEYGIQATFFVNGEFIRQNPDAASLIARSGHETGNMFFSLFDASDARYKPDADFIQRGLARAEDEYFAATGAELSLLWHLPHYINNETLVRHAEKINYSYIGRDIDPLDWVSQTAPASTRALYARSYTLVDRVIRAVQPGSIIPIRIGIPQGGREDYFYKELPLLINALICKGYTFVPVSVLMRHAE